MIQVFKPLLIVVLLSAWSGVQAQTQNVHLHLNSGRVSEELKILTPESSFACNAPARPSKVDSVVALVPQTHDLSSFVRTARRTKPVVVRRGGQTDAKGPESQARFATKFYSREQAADAVDVEFRTVLYFCEYLGFPEFVGLVYTVSGEVGNFTVHKRDAVTPDQSESFSLTYQRTLRRRWNYDKGEVEAPDVLGSLNFLLKLGDIPFQTKEGDGEMLVDLRLRGSIEFPMPEDRQK
ncbi:hypothetical protein [Ruegeria sp. EL01]|jgi:hypothetical protein|uniref:hypothetical protein n=1 Tax=Ruegeria sp. EL01 TaxID=2107578 RepID=UPI000EA811FA|nr:hypothetical protein [Ruegeria sp. EL01]